MLYKYNTVKIKRWILRFIQLQLFLTILSFPFLVSWGLPLSIMSPVSNLVFTPILALFLLLSTFIFFTQLMGIPNGLCIILLEWLTRVWDYVMALGSSTWLIGFAQPSPLIFVVLLAGAFLVLQHKKLNSLKISSICLCLLLCSVIGYLKLSERSALIVQDIPCNKGHVRYLAHNNITMLIDSGFLGQRISAPSWIEHTLIPFLIKSYGHATLEYVIVMQPGIVTFEALAALIKLATVKHLYLVGWEGVSSKQLLSGYGALRRACQEHKVEVIRMGGKQKKVICGDTLSFEYKPLLQQLSYQEITFPALEIIVTTPHKETSMRSAKYKTKTGDTSCP